MVILREACLAYQRDQDEVGCCLKYKFPNGFGVSIAKGRLLTKNGKFGLFRNESSYGDWERWKWELAVIYWVDPENPNVELRSKIVYDTPICRDILSCLSDEDVNTVMDLVEKFPPRPGLIPEWLRFEYDD